MSAATVSAATVEAAAATPMEAATTPMKATAAIVPVEATTTAVEATAYEAPATTPTTAVTTPTAPVSTPSATVTTPSATIVVSSPATAVPGASAKEDATVEPLRPIVAIGCAAIGRVAVVAILTHGRTVIRVTAADIDSKRDLRVRRGGRRQSESKDCKQCEILETTHGGAPYWPLDLDA